MGILIDGIWHDRWYDTASTQGRFVRSDSQFRHWVTADGSAGQTGHGGFQAEKGRYHLYASYACPWASRALIFRTLKSLQDKVSLSIVHWHMGPDGWKFATDNGSAGDPLYEAELLRDLYLKVDPRYSGRVTVPILWDKETATIVSNESSDIIRMFNSAFDQLGAADIDFYPKHLRQEIDEVNRRVYDSVNNGVYKAGFATTQQAYREAVTAVFDALDWLEARLSIQPYLVGTQITEADWRLFTTLVRFDAVYFGHFKCNLKRLLDYPALWAYTRELYQHPGIAETVNMEHIKGHYYGSHTSINPNGIIPLGPTIDWWEPHGRHNINS